MPKRKCFECKTARAGRLDEDGTFYCNACWDRYESSGAVVTAAVTSVIPSPVNHSAAETKQPAVQTRGRDQQNLAPKDDAKPVAAGAKKVNPPSEAEDRPGDSLSLKLLSYFKGLKEDLTKESETLREKLRLAQEERAEVAKQEQRIGRGETVELGNVHDSTQFQLTNLATKHNDLHRPSTAISDAEKALQDADQRVRIMLEKVEEAAAVELSQTRAVESSQTTVIQLSTERATQASIDRAKADLDRAEARLDRAKARVDRAEADLVLAKADLDRTKARLRDAEARLRYALADLRYAKADLDRVMTDRFHAKLNIIERLETIKNMLFYVASTVSAISEIHEKNREICLWPQMTETPPRR